MTHPDDELPQELLDKIAELGPPPVSWDDHHEEGDPQ